MVKNRKVVKCHTCRDNIYSGDFKRSLGRGRWQHLICPEYGNQQAQEEQTLADKIINFIFG